MKGIIIASLLAATTLAQSAKQNQLKQYLVDTEGQVETTDYGVQDNTTYSLRAGPRGLVLLEDTIGRKKLQHFARERQPERVVHASGHGAYGTFTPNADWSNLTAASWLTSGKSSDVFTRFSVVVTGAGGSEVERDTHGFATKIYSSSGNHDLVGNHLSSFFINDGILFPDLIHAVKAEPDKGFPTGGSAHTNAYDFFTQRPEGAFQLMNVLSDLGIPRDVRHIAGSGVHTYRFLNSAGKSTLFKWYWIPRLGLRSFVYDEATKLAGKNGNFQRVDLYNAIEAGMYPEWDFAVQLFPDDGTYTYKGYDLLDPTQVVPFEVVPVTKLGLLQLNRNPTNWFAESESVSFAPSNVVNGVSFVPDALLQWRLMSYDDTANHRHMSPNYGELAVNRPVSPVNNNERDGNMQVNIYEGESNSSPDGIGGVNPASVSATLQYGSETVNGKIGRYGVFNEPFTQARAFYYTLNNYSQQHLVDSYRFELGQVADANVTAKYISQILNNIDNCLARRVAFGVGAPMPAIGSGSTSVPRTKYPSQYLLDSQGSTPLDGLAIAVLADDTFLTTAQLQTIENMAKAKNASVAVVGPHQGTLKTGVVASQSYVTTSSVFYDAIIIGGAPASSDQEFALTQAQFIGEAFAHGKPIGEIGTSALKKAGFLNMPGVFTSSNAGNLASTILTAMASPRRYPQRLPIDDVAAICGRTA